MASENDETQTLAGVGEVISRQQNLTPERRRGERERGSGKKRQGTAGGEEDRKLSEEHARSERRAPSTMSAESPSIRLTRKIGTQTLGN